MFSLYIVGRWVGVGLVYCCTVQSRSKVLPDNEVGRDGSFSFSVFLRLIVDSVRHVRWADGEFLQASPFRTIGT